MAPQKTTTDPDRRYDSSVGRDEMFSVTINGRVREMEAYDLVCQIVMNETHGLLATEALKAHVVATYTMLQYNNERGVSPVVGIKTDVANAIKVAANKVFGRTIYYDGEPINAVYHSTSAGKTTSAEAVWGGKIPYLVSVSSSWDKQSPSFTQSIKISADDFADAVMRTYGIYLDGDPEDWMTAERDGDGGYVKTVTLGGKKKAIGGSVGAGTVISGRSVREQLFGFKLRSHCFEFIYRKSDESFIFTSYGYGHGVGMSQYGAHFMAIDGYGYQDILTHYYTGTTIE